MNEQIQMNQMIHERFVSNDMNNERKSNDQLNDLNGTINQLYYKHNSSILLQRIQVPQFSVISAI